MNVRRKLAYLLNALVAIALGAFALGDPASTMTAVEGSPAKEPSSADTGEPESDE